MLSKETLQELSNILRTEYGANLKPEEVLDTGMRLLGFFDELAKLDFEDKQDDFKGVAPKYGLHPWNYPRVVEGHIRSAD